MNDVLNALLVQVSFLSQFKETYPSHSFRLKLFKIDHGFHFNTKSGNQLTERILFPRTVYYLLNIVF